VMRVCYSFFRFAASVWRDRPSSPKRTNRFARNTLRLSKYKNTVEVCAKKCKECIFTTI